MKIGVFSDIHDQLDNLEKVLEYFQSQKITETLFCGDFCSPVPVKKHIANYPEITINAVFGNTEDRHLITQIAATEVKHLKINGEFFEMELDNRKIFVTHYPEYARGMASTGNYDAVFHGHNHTYSETRVGECILANPGEVAGFKEDASFCVWDTTENVLERVIIKAL